MKRFPNLFLVLLGLSAMSALAQEIPGLPQYHWVETNKEWEVVAVWFHRPPGGQVINGRPIGEGWRRFCPCPPPTPPCPPAPHKWGMSVKVADKNGALFFKADSVNEVGNIVIARFGGHELIFMPMWSYGGSGTDLKIFFQTWEPAEIEASLERVKRNNGVMFSTRRFPQHFYIVLADGERITIDPWGDNGWNWDHLKDLIILLKPLK